MTCGPAAWFGDWLQLACFIVLGINGVLLVINSRNLRRIRGLLWNARRMNDDLAHALHPLQPYDPGVINGTVSLSREVER